MQTILIQYYQSPCGELILGSFEDRLCLCDWVNEKRRSMIDKRIQKSLEAGYEAGSSEVIAKAVVRLDEYFARKRKTFDIPLLLVGTEFQKSVWQELQNIPYGKTLSYGELSQRLGEERERKLKRTLFHRWMQYAAIAVGAFFIGGMGYWFYQAGSRSSESLVTVTANETIKELMLPDGTKVWLNKNTILQYPRNFEGGKRHVYLNGEGFFDVKRNTAKPFIVQSHAMQVRVLGTTFNLKSGENGQRAVATLLKGEVEVKGNHGEGMIVLSPGQQAELDGMTRRLTVKPAEPGIEGWHDTAFDLNQTDIRTLCKILERAYNVKIIIAPDVDIERTYSGPLKKKENVAATLDLIKNSIGIKYKVIGENVFISSSKSK